MKKFLLTALALIMFPILLSGIVHASYVGERSTERSVSGLSSSTNTTLTTASTYYKVSGTFGDNSNNFNFTTATDNKVTYTGVGNSFLFTGASDVKVDKVCELTYALYKNGVLVTGAETPHDFAAASKTENISITSIIDLAENDYLEIFAKSDAANTTVTVETLLTTTWGSF